MAQLVEHLSPKLAGWVQFPVDQTKGFKNGTFREETVHAPDAIDMPPAQHALRQQQRGT